MGAAQQPRLEAHLALLPQERRWSLAELAGRLVELTAGPASAPLSQAMRLVLEAQQAGEPAAWIGSQSQSFFPPDAAALGVDLAALPLVRVVDGASAGRAADKLLRSGAFALVVVELGPAPALPTPLLARLAGLARKHHSALVFVSEQREPGSQLGSFVSVRVESLRRREGQGFACALRALKDRRHGPGWEQRESVLAPPGLS